MLELTLKGNNGFTERTFITKVAVLSVFSRSPLISVCGYISTSPHISNRRLCRLAKISRHLSHIIKHLTNRYLYRPYRLSWFFSYPSLSEYHGIIISVLRVEKYLISLSITRWEISQLILWQVPTKAECPIMPKQAICRSSSCCRHI